LPQQIPGGIQLNRLMMRPIMLRPAILYVKVSVRPAAPTVRLGGQEILIIRPQTRNEYINLINCIQLN
jgi:hypothetical protein